MKRKTVAPVQAEEKKVLVLRTCAANLKSYSGFQWPESGPVECSDWLPRAECGNGLHGWIWGEGDASLGNWSPHAKWLVVSVDASSIVELGGKVKFPRGEVVVCGDRKAATDYILDNGGAGRAVIGAVRQGGDGSTITGGDGSTITGGYRSTITGGDGSTITGGDGSTITGGDGSTITGGDGAEIKIRYWDEKSQRYRTRIGYIGEDGLVPNKKYRLNNDAQFEEVK